MSWKQTNNELSVRKCGTTWHSKFSNVMKLPYASDGTMAVDGSQVG